MKIQSRILLCTISVLLTTAVAAETQRELMEEIVVTAQKREQRLIDVPMTVNTFNSAELEQKSLDTVWDISFQVPGMVMRQDAPGETAIFMRGLGNLTGNEALTSVYLDEVPVTIAGFEQLDLRTLDLDRVEVLKGPQGTLYGQGSVAGTIRFITNEPKLDRVEGSVKTDFASTRGGDASQKITGVVNVPVIDNVLGLRIAAMYDNAGGWIDQPQAGRDDLNNEDLIHVRTNVLWQPTNALEIKAMSLVHRNETDLGRNYSDEDGNIRLGVDRTADAPGENDYDVFNLTLTYNFGFAELLSSTSYIENEVHLPNPFIAGPETAFFGIGLEGLSFGDAPSDQLSQEIRLVSAKGGPLTWTVGGFFRHVDQDFFSEGQSLSTFGLFPTTFRADRESDSWALFADGAYQLTDRLKIGLGVRYFEDDRELFDGATTQEDTFDSVDPRAYLSWAIREDVNIYLNIATGFRSGGFNGAGQPTFGPEDLINYEIGSKASLFNGRLNTELAVFYSEWSDQQRRGLQVVNGQFLNITGNIAEVDIKGVETSIDWQPVDQVRIGFTGSYIDSEVDAVDADSTAVIPGDPGDYAAEYSFTLDGMFMFNWTDNIPGFVRVDYSYRDEVPVTDRNIQAPGHFTMWSDTISRLGGRVGAQINDWRIVVYGTNLTDEDGTVDPFEPWAQAVRLRPRTFGVEVSLDF